MLRKQKTCLEFVTNEMTINLQMFSTFVKNWVMNNMHCCLVVTMKGNREMQRKMELLEKRCTPWEFTSGCSQTAILNLIEGP